VLAGPTGASVEQAAMDAPAKTANSQPARPDARRVTLFTPPTLTARDSRRSKPEIRNICARCTGTSRVKKCRLAKSHRGTHLRPRRVSADRLWREFPSLLAAGPGHDNYGVIRHRSGVVEDHVVDPRNHRRAEVVLGRHREMSTNGAPYAIRFVSSRSQLRGSEPRGAR